ncbi:flavodoxin family protein [Rhodocytophaga aerolata]|uniref:Flavodoxin family protein n=1 Tax=Rhodocytophaga aerolata TaxID=455078 RepID=A0ABT8RFU0_9BACT|nr:flavodoxin family protein [Rhodocytophaga aerolata]MDO1450981.1 flavodoxin family protein [Rhodocytophaga aerolata]
MTLAIVYHSNYGHTRLVAEAIFRGTQQLTKDTLLLSTCEAIAQIEQLHQADGIIFGSPTYFGSVSAEFKKFMEFTGSFWYRQLWKDKIAAGFTNSSTTNGDKLHTLIQLSLFAAQHSMIWVSTGILPVFTEGIQQTEPNGMASYLGFMAQSDNSLKTLTPPADLTTAFLFGKRVAQCTQQFVQTKSLSIQSK